MQSCVPAGSRTNPKAKEDETCFMASQRCQEHFWMADLAVLRCICVLGGNALKSSGRCPPLELGRDGQPGLHITCLPALAPERRGFGEGKHLSYMPLSPPPLASQISSMAGKQAMQAILHPNQVETRSGIPAAAFANKSSTAFVTEVQ